MTERRKDGKKKRPRKVSVEVACQEFIDGLETALKEDPTSEGSRLVWVVILNLIQTGLKHLKHYIETDHADINWSNPYVQLEYDAERKHPGRLTEVEKQLNITAENFFELFPAGMELGVMHVLTRGVEIHRDQQFVEANGRLYNVHVVMPPQVEAEVNALPENEQAAKVTELFEGRRVGPKLFVFAKDTFKTEPFAADLVFVIKPLVVDTIADRTYYPVVVGLNFTAGDPASWSDADQKDFWDASFKALNDEIDRLLESGQPRHKVKKPDQVKAGGPEDFPVAGNYVYPIFALSKDARDFPLLQKFHDSQTLLTWAVGLALFAMTDEDRVRAGDWQEVKINDLVDLVFCLIDQNSPRRGDQREDVLVEIHKLYTTELWYYEFATTAVGRAFKKEVIVRTLHPIQEFGMMLRDTETGRMVSPNDPALRSFRVPLELKGRRAYKPDGSAVMSLRKDRFKLHSIRWRWVQSFNDDLLLTPALIESGKRKGLPKKNTRGKVLRKGYLIRLAKNIIDANQKLRAEGQGMKYAWRLLVMLASNINKTEDGIAADRVFRMLGIPENYRAGHKTAENIVAEAVVRLMRPDIAALAPTSDTTPRTDPNPERRKGPYYRFIRSPEYTPRKGIASREHAASIEAEYAEATPPTIAAPEPTPAPPMMKPMMKQKSLPGLEAPPPPAVPSGTDIRAAREAAGLTLRAFAEQMAGPDFSTWSRYESGKPIRVGKVPSDVWQRVADFIAQHKPKADA